MATSEMGEYDGMPWTYILECADGSLYVGSTTHLDLRLAQHQAGGGVSLHGPT